MKMTFFYKKKTIPEYLHYHANITRIPHMKLYEQFTLYTFHALNDSITFISKELNQWTN